MGKLSAIFNFSQLIYFWCFSLAFAFVMWALLVHIETMAMCNNSIISIFLLDETLNFIMWIKLNLKWELFAILSLESNEHKMHFILFALHGFQINFPSIQLHSSLTLPLSLSLPCLQNSDSLLRIHQLINLSMQKATLWWS